MSDATLSFTGDPLTGLAVGPRHVVQLPARHLRLRLTGILFDSMRTFLLPGALKSVRRLKQIYDDHPGAEVLVVGHADRSGDDRYNLKLSRERADAIAAFLKDDVAVWLAWYHYKNDPAFNEVTPKHWDAREDKYMLSALTGKDGKPYLPPIGPGQATATKDSGFTAAVKRFQTDEGLDVDGDPGDQTRTRLIERYMATDETTLPAGTKLLTHGCGEFHPAVATADGVSEQENRRVEVFLFEDGIQPLPQTPCPKPGCPEHAQWTQGEGVETIDLREDMPRVTGAAWVLDGGATDLVPLTLRVVDHARRAASDREVTIVLPDGLRRFAKSDAQGVVRAEVPKDATKLLVRFTAGPSGTVVEREVVLGLPPVSDDAGAKARLQNLGYSTDADLRYAISQFQLDHGLPATGQLSAPVRSKLAEVHDPK